MKGIYENDVPRAVAHVADPYIFPEKDVVFHNVEGCPQFLIVGFQNRMQQLNMDSKDDLDPFSSTL